MFGVAPLAAGTAEIFRTNVFKFHANSPKLRKVKLTKELKATLLPREVFKGFKVIHYAADVRVGDQCENLLFGISFIFELAGKHFIIARHKYTLLSVALTSGVFVKSGAVTFSH